MSTTIFLLKIMNQTIDLNVTSHVQPSPDAPVALLIHGLGATANTWKRLAENLYDEGFTVHCPELPGHGLSPRGSLYNVQDWIKAIVDLKFTPNVIIGHSIGGLIAAAVQPSLSASTLILIDPVFSIPVPKPLLPIVRFSFAQSVKNSLWLSTNKTAADKLTALLRKNPNSIWDPKTVQALTPNPRVIARQLTTKNHTVVVFRPKGSLIFPYKILRRKTTAENIFYHNLKRGHNSYFSHHESFWEQMKNYLKGEQNHANLTLP